LIEYYWVFFVNIRSENLPKKKKKKHGGRLESERVWSMEVGMLPISASKRGKLLAAGYTTLDAIARASPTHLARGFPFQFQFSTLLSFSNWVCIYVKKFLFFSPTHYLTLTDIDVSESEATEILNLASKPSALERPNGSHTAVVGGMCCVGSNLGI